MNYDNFDKKEFVKNIKQEIEHSTRNSQPDF
jgi:hypothetical protein